jgi:hypothetical protein
MNSKPPQGVVSKLAERMALFTEFEVRTIDVEELPLAHAITRSRALFFAHPE